MTIDLGLPNDIGMSTNIWNALIAHYGTQARLASVCDVSAPSIHDRRRRGTEVPAEWARRIHDDSGIPLHEMRPDLWPEHAAH